MKSFIYLLIFGLLITSCSNDDDGQKNIDQTLDGPWSLVNVSGGLPGVNDDFEHGLIIWDFDIENLELTVTNNNTSNVVYDGLPSGTYDYLILTTTGEDSHIVVNDISLEMSFSSTNLLLDEGVAFDGFLLTFSR